ncbi:TIGR04283 family arsenosugar biosynthesis glycosyltransferase [Parvularcula marina]|uniref:TIGR04283 family arsenosugar biosynthesis glycosyltransferase n=1 Tax=Parvularcula marina TaxID=2292771 RepID=UPI003512DD97
MISVIIPTLNAAPGLGATLESLLEANRLGMIAEVIVSDGGSCDETAQIAEASGAKVLIGSKGRGAQLIRGAEAARGDWLLFLHADTELSPGWEEEAGRHMAGAFDRKAAVFRLGFAASGFKPRLVALGANLRSRIFRLPYGDQGLLISRRHYERLGGFADFPLFEDLDFVRRILREGGRSAVSLLPAVAMTSAERYEREGYLMRVLRNARLVLAYHAGVSPEELAERYNGRLRKKSRAHGKAALDGAGEDPPQP